MIAVIAGRSLKKPARIQVGAEVLNRFLGFNFRAGIEQMTNRSTADGTLDCVIYQGPVHLVAITLDDTQHGLLLHASISRKDADPSWETIKALKAVVFGDIDVMMVLPKQALYVNVHEHCFHLWQMPVDWGIG